MINFTQHFYFRGHLCISTELLGINLYEFIKAYEFKGFPLPLIRRFTKQILSSLILLKGKRVIHCDLKPENILLAHPMHSEIKVIDFGSSCFENEKVYTYIQSRFYRSPEVILGMSYGIPIDMWSLGCILAELYSGYPIFPGENEQEQLACIMEIFGPPEKHLIEKSSRKKLFFDSLGKPRVTVSSKGRRRRPSSKTLQQAIKCDDDAFLDFLAQCLRWDPDRRLKPDQALGHEFITGQKMPRGSTSSMSSASGMNSARPSRIMSSSMVPGQGLSAGGNMAGTSPGKRYTSNPHHMGGGNHHMNSTGATPIRLGRDREASGTIRPLPDPPSLAASLRGPNTASASPSKGYGSSRRVSAAPGGGPMSQQVNGGPVKRVNTGGGPSRQQQNQTPQGPQATAGSSRSRNNQNIGLGVGMGISMDGGGLAGTAAAAAAGVGRTR
jgi:dual specificity tyrosine-phosphorylation-regulated kinase 2/3/4